MFAWIDVMNDIDYEGPSTSLQSSGASKTQSRADEPWSEVSAVGAVPSKSVPRAAAVPPVRPRRITWPAKGRASISGAKNVVRLLWEPLAKSCGLSVCPCKIQNTHIHSQQTCEVFVWDFFLAKVYCRGRWGLAKQHMSFRIFKHAACQEDHIW